MHQGPPVSGGPFARSVGVTDAQRSRVPASPSATGDLPLAATGYLQQIEHVKRVKRNLHFGRSRSLIRAAMHNMARGKFGLAHWNIIYQNFDVQRSVT
jgi:hypothetical protein